LIRGIGEVLLDSGQETTKDPGGHLSTNDEKVLIPLIREEAHAGYLKGVSDKSYLHEVDVYQIPGFEKGDYRLFEIIGDSMVPALHPGEITICEFVEDPSILESSSLCVLIMKKGIVTKRVFQYAEKEGLLILKSDNLAYKTQTIDRSKILETWIIKAKITSLLTSSNSMDAKRLERLESDYEHLKTQVQGILSKDDG
jgi:phage repressor protein C with HTH and peptisase S24 domain